MAFHRAPLLALAAVGLVAGLWGGLARLGVELPAPAGDAAELHGQLMVLGFLGTLVSLERAVALGRGWAYVAPAAAGAGTVAALAGAGGLGPALLALGGATLVACHVHIDRIQRTVHNAVMGLGALGWLGAAVWWLAGAATSQIVVLLAGFLVLTIVGERLELSRVRRLGPRRSRLLLAAIALLLAGMALSPPAEEAGVRLAGAGLVAQAAWLGRYDVARRTVRARGLTRFMAIALLAGYAWLGLAGALWLASGAWGAGFAYDAALHALFLGFVMSMVFAHAPVILPSVLRVPLPYRPRFYAHLALLHASLAARMLADLAGDAAVWRWAGVLNEAAILLFAASSAAAVAGARRGARAGRSPARAIAR
jgi:hypothetical protein